ncbi:MAG: hypothetical protein K0S76_1765 [Herbinix sp.]|jgi:sensor histidine kinase YesM|nr:hypothetical protein [Herbinix sp.]
MRVNWVKGSIRRKLILVFVFTTGIVFCTNMFMYNNINKSIGTIDKVYVSNVGFNELVEALTKVQDNVYDYLNTKSTVSLENYYRSEEYYRDLTNNLNSDITDNDMVLMQKNIKNMSSNYLKILDEAVNSKRGRNIERYKEYYENATTIYGYIKTYINNLNNEQFKYNSDNYELLLLSLQYLEVISTVVLLVITSLNIVLIIIMTRRITGPLTKLTDAANEVAAGNFEVDLVQLASSDELEIVMKAFRTMIGSIHQYIIKTRESLELESRMKEKELMMTNHLKDAQLKYLQAQINPHFLFNTLNAGAQLAMMEGADKTCLFIENMASFFRYNMKSLDKDSTIRDEIKLVDSYIYILNVRFSGKIHFYKEIDENLLDIRVPSMILQPIVENAVNYGIRDIDYEGIISMRVFETEEDCSITIMDNGAGMDSTTMERILKRRTGVEASREKTMIKDSGGIGLRNVITRLELYYDKDDILDIYSGGNNRGTHVTIRIPKK